MKLVAALRQAEPVFLSSPYTRFWRGHPAAYLEICKLASRLFMESKIVVFSPIAHGHGLAAHGDMPAVNAKLWERFNGPFVDMCKACIVAKLDGWRESDGVKGEIKDFSKAKKMVVYCDPMTLELSLD